MSDELREAAERIVRRAMRPDDDATIMHPAELFGASFLIAQAYLAEHPSDDGEPIDVGWVRSTYGWGNDDDGWIPFGNLEAGYDIGGHIGVRHLCHRSHRLVFGPYKTRGAFRKAAAALGIIELKEAKAS